MGGAVDPEYCSEMTRFKTKPLSVNIVFPTAAII
jgi:hypothetical protein